MDLLNDPDFPDRPAHPDFWRLSECVTWHDGEAGEGGNDPFQIIGIDEDSLTYLMTNRIGMIVQIMHGTLPKEVVSTMMALYLDAFSLGKRFAERGGRQEAG